MKRLMILGAGTAGTSLANRMQSRLPGNWGITVVDPALTHLYQPGLIWLPFGAKDEHHMVKRRAATLHRQVEWVQVGVDRVDPGAHQVRLTDGRSLGYDLLVIASGSRIRPDLVEGLEGNAWHHTVHDYYTLEGALALRDALPSFAGGRLVVNVVEVPIKCPVAPLEFLFLADSYFRRRGNRREVELVLATPLDGAFTRPLASARLSHLLDEKGITVETEFMTGTVRTDEKKLVSWDEREIDYDLLVSIPTHSGADFVEQSEIGDELAFIPTDPHTLAAQEHDDIFVVGDATDLNTSKAGSVAHFEAELLTENLLRAVEGKDPRPTFDGHANCFVETGGGKAMLIDFNYDVEPLPGRYPWPPLGPFPLLAESRRNHWGKLLFRWMYWNMLLPGRHIPISAKMPTRGKDFAAAQDHLAPTSV